MFDTGIVTLIMTYLMANLKNPGERADLLGVLGRRLTVPLKQFPYPIPMSPNLEAIPRLRRHERASPE